MNSIQNTISIIASSFLELQAKLQFYEREYLKKKGVIDVTASEVKVLYIIGLSNTKSMSDIAAQLKVTKGTLSIAVDSLVKKGYVIRTRNHQDRRIIILYLTDKALHAVKTYENFYQELLEALALQDVSQFFTLKEIISRLNHVIEVNFLDVEAYQPVSKEDMQT